MALTSLPVPTPIGPAAEPARSSRRRALIAGVLYLVTFAASIPTLVLYAPVLNDPAYVLGAGPDTAMLWGGVLDMITGIAGIGTAVALFPVVKRHNESVALGFVASRTLEAAIIAAGVVALLPIATLRQAGLAGTDAATLLGVNHALVAAHNWSFLLGPGVIPGINALLLGTLLYRTGLVPRIIPAVGLVGAPLLLGSALAEILGLYSQLSVWSAVATIPIFLWELSLGVWLTVKGFTPTSAGLPAGPDDVPPSDGRDMQTGVGGPAVPA